MRIHKYDIYRKIGEGKFGEVFSGKNIKTNEKIAFKIEYTSSPFKILKYESTILHYLVEKQLPEEKDKYIPTIYWFGKLPPYTGIDAVGMIIPYYKYSLHEFCREAEVSIREIYTIIRVIISALKFIHSHNICHRDIKPQNIMFHETRGWALIDFGLSAFTIDENGESIYKENTTGEKKEHIVGTPKYISWNIHRGEVPAKRDDLISLGYVVLYCLFGEDFWNQCSMDGIEIQSEEKCDTHILFPNNLRLLYRKQLAKICDQTSFFEKTQGLNIKEYFRYLYGLQITEIPRYHYLSELFSTDAK